MFQLFERRAAVAWAVLAVPCLAMGCAWLYRGFGPDGELDEGLLRNDLFQGAWSSAMGIVCGFRSRAEHRARGSAREAERAPPLAKRGTARDPASPGAGTSS